MTDQKFYPDEATKRRCLENLRESNRQLSLYNLSLDDAISQVDSQLRQYKRKRLVSQEYQTSPTIESQN
jgi:ribosome-associated translation inhibitor RaiA